MHPQRAMSEAHVRRVNLDRINVIQNSLSTPLLSPYPSWPCQLQSASWAWATHRGSSGLQYISARALAPRELNLRLGTPPTKYRPPKKHLRVTSRRQLLPSSAPFLQTKRCWDAIASHARI